MRPAFCMHDGAIAISNAIVHTYPSNPPTDLMCWVHFLRAVQRNLGKVSAAPFQDFQDPEAMHKPEAAHKARCKNIIEDLKVLHYINDLRRFEVAKRLFCEKWQDEVSHTVLTLSTNAPASCMHRLSL